MSKIKFSSTLDIEPKSQHAFLPINKIATSICGDITFSQRIEYFDLLEDEDQSEMLCDKCFDILNKLDTRSTEIQRAYDVSIKTKKELEAKLEEKLKELSSLKLSIIKEDSFLLKIKNRAKELGIKEFL